MQKKKRNLFYAEEGVMALEAHDLTCIAADRAEHCTGKL